MITEFNIIAMILTVILVGLLLLLWWSLEFPGHHALQTLWEAFLAVVDPEVPPKKPKLLKKPKKTPPMFVEAWVGWRIGKDGNPAPMICDWNPGFLPHVTAYRFQVPPDVIEHLTVRDCMMLDKFGKPEKDCR